MDYCRQQCNNRASSCWTIHLNEPKTAVRKGNDYWMWQLPWPRHVSVPSRPVLMMVIDSKAQRYESIVKASCSFARLAEPSHWSSSYDCKWQAGRERKSNPTFSAAVVLTWHANLSSLSHFLSRWLNNSLIRLEKMMMILKLTGALIEIYRLLLLFLLLSLA